VQSFGAVSRSKIAEMSSLVLPRRDRLRPKKDARRPPLTANERTPGLRAPCSVLTRVKTLHQYLMGAAGFRAGYIAVPGAPHAISFS